MQTVQLVGLLLLLTCHLVMSGATSSTTAYEDRIKQLESVSKQLARQLMLQQLYVDEQTRSNGDSGIKQVRLRRDGTKPYYTSTHSGGAMAAMHDHSDLVRSSGLGEMVVVLNGVEFRTRHNDYKLKMPSSTSREYHATEDVPFPDVPPEVSNKSSLDEQISEMRQWFQAWRNSNSTLRDYRKYFKPLLCYLEGAWTNDDDKVDEPFESDRHHIAADSWQELQEQIRFTAYTGDKSNLENFAYLPTTIMNVTNDGVPVFAQWNYRILCHLIRGIDLKVSNLKPIDNLPNRFYSNSGFERYLTTRGARFSINTYGSDRIQNWDLLDKIMNQIPGKDNYGAHITDDIYNLKKLDVFTDRPLNTAYYHRWYKVQEKGAMGDLQSHRGFADRNLFVAETTQPKVASSSNLHCLFPNNRLKRTCSMMQKRMSYAIPLEIMWLTPLLSWNPYDIEYKGVFRTAYAKTVTGENNQRNGGFTPDTAYNGTHSKAYFITPIHFFSGTEVDTDTADTTRGSVGVLDRQGNLRFVRSSGIRVFLPEISGGLGVLRTRFPIMPVYAEGSSIWKEVEALRDIVMNMGKYAKFFQTPPPFTAADHAIPKYVVKASTLIHSRLHTSLSKPGRWGEHMHTIALATIQFKRLTLRNLAVDLVTSTENGHAHAITADYDEETKQFLIIKCDGWAQCFDGHSSILTPDV